MSGGPRRCVGGPWQGYALAFVLGLLLAGPDQALAATRAQAEAAIAAAEAIIAAAETAGVQAAVDAGELDRARALLAQRGYTRASEIADALRAGVEQTLAAARQTEIAAAEAAASEAAATEATAVQAAVMKVQQATEGRLQSLKQQLAAFEQQQGAIEQQLGGFDEGLKQLQAASAATQQALTDQGTRLDSGLARFDPLTVRIDGLAEELKRADEQLRQHEARLEENSLKLFETLMVIDGSAEAVEALRARVDALARTRQALPRRGADEAAASADAPPADDDNGSLLLALVLGLAFPVGVMLYLGAGRGGADGVDAIGGGLLPWLAGGLGYAVLGFGLMYGSSLQGLVGVPWTMLPELLHGGAGQAMSQPLLQLSMQLPLAGAAGLLFCSAVAGRVSPAACLLAALVMGALLYPLVGHWTLSQAGVDAAPAQPIGWLAVVGVTDALDAIGLAALAGVGSLALAWGMGRPSPADGTAMPRSNTSIAIGTLVLWAAWLVSVLATGADNASVPWLAMASAVAASGAAVAVALVGLLRADERSWEQRLPGGLLAGVLAASAAYALAGLLPMLVLGMVTGAVHALSSSAVRRRLGPGADLALAFAVGGISGALAPGLFGPEGLLAAGVLAGLITQALGLAVALVLAVVAGTLVARALRALPDSRVNGP